MKIESDIFTNNGKIPTLYTCNGLSKLIPLKVSDVPLQAQSLALIVDDPDAPNGDFVHWVVWNIDPRVEVIEDIVGLNAMEGYTSMGEPGWVAPCPPSGIHHYNFKLYALSDSLSIPESSTKSDLIYAMEGFVIDNAILVGIYGKDM